MPILAQIATRISTELKLIKSSIASIASSSIPSGMVTAYTGLTAPPGYFLCHGQEVDRGTYAALFAVIGTTHGSGNGTTTFNLPDYRGLFLRGIDLGKGIDPEPTRLIGSFQECSNQEHNHNSSFSGDVTLNEVGSGAGGGTQGFIFTGGQAASPNRTYGLNGSVSVSNVSSGNVSNESRPKNIAVNYIIKS